MKKAGEILIQILETLEKDKYGTYSRFFSSWENLAGTDTANHSEIKDLKNGILYIEADHPGWLQMIQLNKMKLIKKINAEFPELKVDNIRIFLKKHDKIVSKKNEPGLEKVSNDLNFKKIIERLNS